MEWKTTSLRRGKPVSFTVTGRAGGLDHFDLSEPTPAKDVQCGTEVVISNLGKDFTSLSPEKAPDELAKMFAIYLSVYPDIELEYEGVRVDPKSVQLSTVEYPLDESVASLLDVVKYPVSLSIIEWKEPTPRALYFCDRAGVSLHQTTPGIQAPGYHFTAYLKSDYFRELDKGGLLALEELHSTVGPLAATAKDRMRIHFRRLMAEHAVALVQGWRDAGVYPYKGDPVDPLEVAERQVFDVVAVNVNSYLDKFEEASDTNKRFTFKLLQQSLKENPASLQRIFSEVLDLPREKQDEFAELLQKTSMVAILGVAKLITDRLNFLKGLEALVFDKDTKEQMLERDQLHKVLANETWIFGENFHLTHNESTLDEVLNKHLVRLGQRRDNLSPVVREDDKQGRIDLMLSRTVPQSRSDEAEYLVIELKRPSRKIDSEVLSQVESYAIAVAEDERFRNTKTRWVFWAVSNDITNEASRRARQSGRPEGLFYDDAELCIQAWAKSWAQLIRDGRARLEHLRARLNYEADRDSAKAYLMKTHEKYVPRVGICAEIFPSDAEGATDVASEPRLMPAECPPPAMEAPLLGASGSATESPSQPD